MLESRINTINQPPTVMTQDVTVPESSSQQHQQQPQQQQQQHPSSSSSTNPTLHSIIEDQLQGQRLNTDDNNNDGQVNSILRDKPTTTGATKKWRGGKILKKYPDGTYDIQLTNGGMLSRVKRKLIRATAAGGSNAKPTNNNTIVPSNT